MSFKPIWPMTVSLEMFIIPPENRFQTYGLAVHVNSAWHWASASSYPIADRDSPMPTQDRAHPGTGKIVREEVLGMRKRAAATISYTFALAAGQTLPPGTSWLFDAKAGGNGTVHPTSGDTNTLKYVTGGGSLTQNGHF